MVRPLLCCALLAACATGNSAPDVSVTPVSARVVTSTGSGVVDLSRSTATVAVPVAVNASPDSVFLALLAVYKELGVTTSLLDGARRTAGNEFLKARRRFAEAPMASYFDCGASMGQPNAETYDMEIGIVSSVSPAAGGSSTITTTLSAAGNNPTLGRDRQLRCASTGELEKRIVRTVREILKLK